MWIFRTLCLVSPVQCLVVLALNCHHVYLLGDWTNKSGFAYTVKHLSTVTVISEHRPAIEVVRSFTLHTEDPVSEVNIANDWQYRGKYFDILRFPDQISSYQALGQFLTYLTIKNKFSLLISDFIIIRMLPRNNRWKRKKLFDSAADLKCYIYMNPSASDTRIRDFDGMNQFLTLLRYIDELDDTQIHPTLSQSSSVAQSPKWWT